MGGEINRRAAAVRLRRRIARQFDATIDDAAHDGQKTVFARLVLLVLMALLVAANIGSREAAAWFAAGLVCEVGCRRASLALGRGRARPVRMRMTYLALAAAVTLIWSCLPLLFWVRQDPALGAAAILILATQLIHAQAFTYRSLPVLTITGGLPATVMLALPWLAGPFTGLHLFTFSFVTLLAVGYTLASVHANRQTAKSLRSAQDELERFAYFDALTSLANRRLFSEHLRKLIALSRRRGTRFALLLIDLDRFKEINDTLGHDAGDALLIEVGARLRRAVRSSDHVARLGGDEFAVLIPEGSDGNEVKRICARIALSFADAVEFNGTRITPSPSVGVAMFPDHGDHQDSLYKAADLALYEAKRSGRNTWRYSAGTRPVRRRAETGPVSAVG